MKKEMKEEKCETRRYHIKSNFDLISFYLFMILYNVTRKCFFFLVSFGIWVFWLIRLAGFREHLGQKWCAEYDFGGCWLQRGGQYTTLNIFGQ